MPMYASALAAAPPGSICETVTVLENSRAVSQPRFFTTSPSICASTLMPPPKPTQPSQNAVVKRSRREGRARVVERAVARRNHSAVLPRTLLMGASTTLARSGFGASPGARVTPGRPSAGRGVRGCSVEQCTMDLRPGREVLGDVPPTACKPPPERLRRRPTTTRSDEGEQLEVLQPVPHRLQPERGDEQRRFVPHLGARPGIEEGSVPVAAEPPDVSPRLAVLLPGCQRVEVQLAVDPFEEGEHPHRTVPRSGVVDHV